MPAEARMLCVDAQGFSFVFHRHPADVHTGFLLFGGTKADDTQHGRQNAAQVSFVHISCCLCVLWYFRCLETGSYSEYLRVFACFDYGFEYEIVGRRGYLDVFHRSYDGAYLCSVMRHQCQRVYEIVPAFPPCLFVCMQDVGKPECLRCTCNEGVFA